MQRLVRCGKTLMMLDKIVCSEFIKEIFSCVFLECLHVVKDSSAESQEVAMVWVQDVQGSPSIISDKLASDKFWRMKI